MTPQEAADRYVATGNRIFQPSVVQNSTSPRGGGLLGEDGFLSKLGETALDLVGLYGEYDLQKTRIENAGGDRQDPSVAASQARAGVGGFVVDNRVPIYVVGGIVVVGVIAAITIAALRKK